MLEPSLHALEQQAKKDGLNADYISRLLEVAKTLQNGKFPTVFSLMHLSVLTNSRWKSLRKLVRREADPYRCFKIRKRSGGDRMICAPSPELQRVQAWIHRNVLCSPGALSKLHKASTAYAPKCSIRENASRHSGAAWLVKVDIKDFFESISERQVYYVFRGFGYPAIFCFELARLCTRVLPPKKDGGLRKREKMWRWTNNSGGTGGPYGPTKNVGHLPQGAPTSAMLANFVANRLDEEIQVIADKYGATFTRYADDIVLSKGESSRAECSWMLKEVVKVVSFAGFRINRKKTHLLAPGARKVVTGLITNDSVPRLPQSMKDDIRICLHHIRKRGLLKHMEKKKARSPLGYLNHLVGRILFAHSIENQFGSEAMKELRAALAPYGEMLALIREFDGDKGASEFENLHRLVAA